MMWAHDAEIAAVIGAYLRDVHTLGKRADAAIDKIESARWICQHDGTGTGDICFCDGDKWKFEEEKSGKKCLDCWNSTLSPKQESCFCEHYLGNKVLRPVVQQYSL